MSAEQKKRFAIICTIVFAVLLTLSVLLSMPRSGRQAATNEPVRLNIVSPIPAEELFLPDEPDYLPGVILERSQRSVWTDQDAAEYWQDPLRFGEEQWREMIEEAIDKFLESIP